MESLCLVGTGIQGWSSAAMPRFSGAPGFRLVLKPFYAEVSDQVTLQAPATSKAAIFDGNQTGIILLWACVVKLTANTAQ